MAKRKTLPKEFEQLLQTGTDEEIKAVFEKCDINAYGGYNKHNALCFPMSYERMKWLIEQGADINYLDKFGNTPLLYLASRSFAQDQAINLVKLGADIHYQYKMYRENALYGAISAGSLKLVQCLIEAGIETNTQNWRQDMPLESAFCQARAFDLMKLIPITKYLLSVGVPVTEKLKNYFIEIAKDIEFRRKDIHPKDMQEIDSALECLYELFQVEPVPRKVEYDGKSPIIIQVATWQKMYQELWELLVPGSSHANTIQGEVIRITGRVSNEILDNGGINWDSDYREMCKAFLEFVELGTPLAKDEISELKSIIKTIKNVDEKECARMTELGVKWVTLNTEPMEIGQVKYRR